MLRLTELKLPLDHDEPALKRAILKRLALKPSDLRSYTVFRRGHDARKVADIQLVYTVDVDVTDEATALKRLDRDRNVGPTPDLTYQFVARAPASLKTRPVVIGMGPCGIFAGLVLAQMGFRPIILERGKIVRERTVDTFAFWRRRILNPDSNVQFGEGGAGTFSDGKLHSGVKEPVRSRKVLEEFVKAGAPEEILTVSKPHIGTFRLVSMVENIRASIEALGGEIRFNTKVTGFDLSMDNRAVRGVFLDDSTHIATDRVVMAVGHSARETFAMLYEHDVFIEPKPFSIGVRIEHPQSLIDRCRYGKHAGNPLLGAADYHLVHHCANGRSVYSFCMCPGGTVVAAASEPGRVVTNGMSQYSRSERNANSGLVVGITPADYQGHPLAGIAFQREWEERAFAAGGGTYDAPGQRVGDFLAGRPSESFGAVTSSYRPGVHPTDLSRCLPDFVVTALREAIPAFDRQIKGYAMEDAVMTAVESRTSAPIRVTRNETFQSLNTPGLFPAGEGAGYAGGILSAGIDGIKAAEAVARSLVP